VVPSHPDSRRRGLLAALMLAGALLPALAGQAVRLTDEAIRYRSKDLQFNSDGSTQTIVMKELVLTQGTNTLISAGTADVTAIDEEYRNSTWNLSGEVHVEHHGAVLDAPEAKVAFGNSRLQVVDVRGAGATPARFSHQNSATGTRYDGSASAIRFEPASGEVRLQPPVRFSQGSSRFACSKAMVYNVNTNGFVSVDDGRSDTGCEASVDFDDVRRVPPPRQPERSQAQ